MPMAGASGGVTGTAGASAMAGAGTVAGSGGAAIAGGPGGAAGATTSGQAACPDEERTPAAAKAPPAGARWVEYVEPGYGKDSSSVQGVALGGEVFVGTHYTMEESGIAVRWNAAGQRERIHPGNGWRVRSVDDSGRIVILATDRLLNKPKETALVQDTAGADALSPPATEKAELRLVSGNGRVLVYADGIWSRKTGKVSFGADIAPVGPPAAVNRDGRIVVGGVGSVLTTAPPFKAWIWRCGSGYKPLPCAATYRDCQATAVSDDGSIIYGLGVLEREPVARVDLLRWKDGELQVVMTDVSSMGVDPEYAPRVSGDGTLGVFKQHTAIPWVIPGIDAAPVRLQDYMIAHGMTRDETNQYELSSGLGTFLSRDGTVVAAQGTYNSQWAVTIPR